MVYTYEDFTETCVYMHIYIYMKEGRECFI